MGGGDFLYSKYVGLFFNKIDSYLGYLIEL